MEAVKKYVEVWRGEGVTSAGLIDSLRRWRVGGEINKTVAGLQPATEDS